MNNKRTVLASVLPSIGLLLIAAAVVIPILSGGFPESPLYKWLYTAGTVVCIVASFITPAPPKSASFKERRWAKIESWSSMFFLFGAYFLWFPISTARDWLAFTLAGAFIRIIVFFRSFRKAK